MNVVELRVFHLPLFNLKVSCQSFGHDCTRVTWFYLLKQKSDVSSVFPRFHNMIKTQFGAQIRFYSDIVKDFFQSILVHIFF